MLSHARSGAKQNAREEEGAEPARILGPEETSRLVEGLACDPPSLWPCTGASHTGASQLLHPGRASHGLDVATLPGAGARGSAMADASDGSSRG
jgi:hypothetical protein